jgi:hypothetical protein
MQKRTAVVAVEPAVVGFRVVVLAVVLVGRRCDGLMATASTDTSIRS